MLAFSGRFLPVMCAAACVVSSGCFEHREAPRRPVTANSVEEAVAKDGVERVILNGTKLNEVPAELSSLPALETLYMRDCGLTSFAALASLKSLRELDVSENRLEAPPPELGELASLERLYLSSCGLKEFPLAVSGLAKLEYLNLDRNSIETLPDSLPLSLKWLRLNNNRLSSLPDSIGSIAGLKRLYLNGNSLAALPESVSSLTSLEDVALGNNKLSEFPKALLSLQSLRNLDLRGNPLTSLPEDIGQLKNLRTLVLSHCGIPKEERKRIAAALPDCVINF